MRVLVTGAAGFIGHAVSAALLDRGDAVVGVDNFNDSYDVGLKRHRLAELTPSKQFTFAQLDVSSRQAVEGINSDSGPFSHIVHLAAQAGVRKSTEQPYLFLRDNIDAHLNMLELCRATDGFRASCFCKFELSLRGQSRIAILDRAPGRAPDVALRRDKSGRRTDQLQL